jgi:aspartate kinase
MKMDIKVIKIGGAVLSRKAGVSGAIALLNGLRNRNAVVIVSALGKSTSLLKELAQAAQMANNTAIHQTFTNLKNIYSEFELSLFGAKMNYVKDYLKLLEQIVDSVKLTRELSARVLDRVLAFGEIMTAELLRKWLAENDFNFEFIPATELIITTKDFGQAKPIDELITKQIQDRIQFDNSTPKIILTQGFIAASENGDTTTMGYESSNLTAALIAREVSAKYIEIWTLPEGIRSSDPLLFDNTQLIKGLSYKQGIELADAGLKLLHKGMLEYAEAEGIELIYRSALDPTGLQTKINGSEYNRQAIIVLNEEGNGEMKFHYISNQAIDGLFRELRTLRISQITIDNYIDYYNVTIKSNLLQADSENLRLVIEKYI